MLLALPFPAPAERPRIGLVLSGEGYLGAANIGVIRVLEELRIPVDVIVGSGMGAVVGGSYATGQTVSRIEEAFATTRWDKLLADVPPAKYVEIACASATADGRGCADPDDQPTLLSSPDNVTGRRQDLLLQQLIAGSGYALIDFDDLAIPFRIVNGDLETFSAVIFDSGNLALALRPGLATLDPAGVVRADGRLLIDIPGLTRAISVNSAMELGADVLIVVDTSYIPPRVRDAVGAESFFRALIRGYSLRYAQESVEILGPDDFLIRPDFEVGTGDFSDIEPDAQRALIAEVIESGARAARRRSDQLASLTVSEREYADWRKQFGDGAAMR